MLLRVLLGVVLVAAGVALIMRNEVMTEVHFFGDPITGVPVWQVMVVSLLLGAGVSAVACAWPLVRYRLRLRRDRLRITELEREVHGLRTLPLGEGEAEDAVEAGAE
jgi:hypothetical protein